MPLQPANELPKTGNPWIDWIIGIIIPIALGLIYLLIKWLRKYLKNKIKEQEHKLTKEIKKEK